jgi:hypothetical protein
MRKSVARVAKLAAIPQPRCPDDHVGEHNNSRLVTDDRLSCLFRQIRRFAPPADEPDCMSHPKSLLREPVPVPTRDGVLPRQELFAHLGSYVSGPICGLHFICSKHLAVVSLFDLLLLPQGLVCVLAHSSNSRCAQTRPPEVFMLGGRLASCNPTFVIVGVTVVTSWKEKGTQRPGHLVRLSRDGLSPEEI